MRAWLKNMKISFILTALMYVALGVVFLVWPTMSSLVICYTLGAVLTIYGVILVAGFFVKGDSMRTFQFELMIGIIAGGLGIFTLISPATMLKALPILLGAIILIDGFITFKRAVELHGFGYEKWWVVLILGLITLALAILVILNPFAALDTLLMVIGAILIYQGISDLWVITRITRSLRRLQEDITPVEGHVVAVEDDEAK